jgi:hypothetical protein
MAIVASGPGGGGTYSGGEPNWDDLMLAAVKTSFYGDKDSGSSVQKGGGSAGEQEIRAQADQLIGVVGPRVEEWNPEKFARMIQYF